MCNATEFGAGTKVFVFNCPSHKHAESESSFTLLNVVPGGSPTKGQRQVAGFCRWFGFAHVFVSCLFVLPGSGSTLIDRSGSRVFLLHRAHPNSAPSVLFAQHLAAVFVFVVSHLPVPNSDHHDHQKDKFLVDIMVLHASYSLP